MCYHEAKIGCREMAGVQGERERRKETERGREKN